jgi:hypothetical protein
MELSAKSTAIPAKKPTGRSRITNGRGLVFADGRTAIARRIRDIYEQTINDLGGFDALSEGQRQLAKRAGMLSSLCEGIGVRHG